ncbi:MAG: hypothetical protein NXI22_09925 [bacterium]|nr:hypothetical protein [bacterium]
MKLPPFCMASFARSSFLFLLACWFATAYWSEGGKHHVSAFLLFAAILADATALVMEITKQ